MDQPQPFLLDHDVLVLRQIRSFLSNDFAINDPQGQQIGTIRTEGGALGRMFLGSRKLSVLELDGATVLRLADVMGIGRDRMNIQGPGGEPLAELIKRITFMKTRCDLVLASGETLTMQGSMFDLDYQVTGPRGTAASVQRSYAGAADFLLGRDTYVLRLTPGVPAYQRAAILGGVIGADLIAQKNRNKS